MGHDSPTPLIRLRGLTHSYPDGRSALRDVTFDVRGGERVALVLADRVWLGAA